MARVIWDIRCFFGNGIYGNYTSLSANHSRVEKVDWVFGPICFQKIIIVTANPINKFIPGLLVAPEWNDWILLWDTDKLFNAVGFHVDLLER